MTFSLAAMWSALPALLGGAGLTIVISLVAMALAVVLGLVVAVISQIPNWLPRLLVRIYVEFFRNTPLLIQIFIIYFGLPQFGIRFAPFACAVIALTLYIGAYNVEVFRAGLEAVPKGQMEAARATGLSAVQVARYVVVPQALRISFPALGNNLASLVKNTSLVSTIGVAELMFSANDISFNNFHTFDIYAVTVVLYVAIVLLMTRILAFVETRYLSNR